MATGLIVQEGWKPQFSGIAEHGHYMVKHLTELGERVVVLTAKSGLSDEVEFDSSCGYPVIRYAVQVSAGEWHTFSDMRRRVILKNILRTIRAIRPHYLISNSGGPLSKLSVSFAAKIARIPCFEFVHHIDPDISPFDRILRRSHFLACSLLLCVSNDTAREVVNLGASPHKVRVIPNGLDMRDIDQYQRHTGECSSSRLDIGCSPDVHVLLTVSRLVEYKGIQRVIEAMPRILSEVPNTRYVVVGDGEYREELMRLACASPARDSIVFLGTVTDAEKLECYERCSVFVMPSEVEGFGIVFLEANAFGKPVIGGDVMGVPEAIADGETGLLVDPYNVDAMAEATVHLLRNPDEARRLGENGRRRVAREFTWEASAEKFLAATRALL